MKLLRTKCISLERRNVRFANCRENQVNGDSIRTKKSKLQFKVAAKVPFRQVQFVSSTVQFTLQEFPFLNSLLHNFFCQSRTVVIQVYTSLQLQYKSKELKSWHNQCCFINLCSTTAFFFFSPYIVFCISILVD